MQVSLARLSNHLSSLDTVVLYFGSGFGLFEIGVITFLHVLRILGDFSKAISIFDWIGMQFLQVSFEIVFLVLDELLVTIRNSVLLCWLVCFEIELFGDGREEGRGLAAMLHSRLCLAYAH